MDYNQVIEKTGEVIDAAGVAVIVIGAAIAAGAGAVRLFRRDAGAYRRFRQQLGQTILLGLELLVAADIVRTVAAEPTFASVGVLGIIVLIRTFLSFSLEVELTGRWPWQQKDSTVQSVPEKPAQLCLLGMLELDVAGRLCRGGYPDLRGCGLVAARPERVLAVGDASPCS
jgi:uncharacterized membrane protein